MPELRDLGQLFMAGFHGCSLAPDHWLIRALGEDNLGGVILFDRNVDGSVQNIRSPDQVRELIGQLQEAAQTPLCVAVDQEGGRVCRFKERDGFLPSRSAAELAALGVAATAAQSEALAAELAGLGVNLNFAPVVDLDLNPDNPVIGGYQRSFGALPEVVCAHAQAVIKAHHRYGVGCCLKHFPGHGSSGADSHLGIVDCTDQWQACELAPYRLLLAQGYADGIMTAHIINRRLDPTGKPATMSRAIITDLLRGELGFTGVVFSDDLQMQAITQGLSYTKAVQEAVLAGVDVLVVGNNLAPRDDAVETGIRAVTELLDSGQVSPRAVHRSLARIAHFKQHLAGAFPWN
ncbi:MAG: beta-N-acetylhexosaminidase [Desulfobulbus sp.]|jgi:beta-N-acetylhexosaminidase